MFCKLLRGATLAVAMGVPAGAIAQPEIVVGVLQPLSGPLAPYALETQPVVEHIAASINREGGIRSMGGAKIRLVIADSAAQSAQAVREARRLATQEGAKALVGPLLTNDMLAIAGVIDEQKLPTISMLGGATQSEYAFSLGLPYDQGYAANMVGFVDHLKKQGAPIRKAVTAYTNYEAGQQVNKLITQRLKDIGVEVVGDVPLDMKSADLTSSLIRIRAADPDLIIGLQLRAEIVRLQQARYQLKYNKPIFVGNTSFADPRLKAELGPEVGREVLQKSVFGIGLYSPDSKIAAAQTIAAELAKAGTMKVSFGQFSIAAAQTMRVLQVALEAAGSTDPDKLKQAIARVKIPFGDPYLYFPVPVALEFGPNRLLSNSESLVLQWGEGDAPEVVFPERFATRKPQL